MTQNPGRRRFVLTILSVGAALGGGLAVRFLSAGRSEHSVLLQLGEIFPSVEESAALKEIVVKELQITDATAVHCLQEALPDWSQIDMRTSEKFLKAVREKIRSDFETGDTVRVRKWLLSRTEAYLMAAVSVSSQGEVRQPFQAR